ncbi:hypothetical protein TREMEDRAFT_65964 [Tremella mesenterica DSM 1558]|uniref:uncharacterized protein n=1 Tax=Tremella mesenterica (strain ATCC 24925 / CBS 8224 / DSM 1558 / NBRC 9311 / NRRL Y-6157 / RJB 2259-6 / UBC 559-6) TaxID=578456 RepID=UPI00032C86C7|nr:uncharacterized protein TREMEDRAFT_65964 [Tremella mesenterica DSM 1558]EIW66115.1 hypothetical protein TREMEDRAFT_65964 [Tremella mesenterica DSM 1558]
MPKPYVSETMKRLGKLFTPPPPPAPPQPSPPDSPPTSPLRPPTIYAFTPTPSNAQREAVARLFRHDRLPSKPPNPSTRIGPTLEELISFADPALPIAGGADDYPPLVDLILSQSLTQNTKAFPHLSGESCDLVNAALDPGLIEYTRRIDRNYKEGAVVEKIMRKLREELNKHRLKRPIQSYAHYRVRQFVGINYIGIINMLLEQTTIPSGHAPQWGMTPTGVMEDDELPPVPEAPIKLDSTSGLYFTDLPRDEGLAYAILEFETPKQIPSRVFDAIEQAFERGLLTLGPTGKVQFEVDEEAQRREDQYIRDSMTRAMGRVWCYMRLNKCRIGVLSTLKDSLVFYAVDQRLRIGARMRHGRQEDHPSCKSMFALLLAMSLMNPNDLLLPHSRAAQTTYSAFRLDQ